MKTKDKAKPVTGYFLVDKDTQQILVRSGCHTRKEAAQQSKEHNMTYARIARCVVYEF